jgi:hypothetical protein
VFGVDDGAGFVGVGAVAGDGGAVVAEVDVGLVAGYALAGDAGALEAADEFFGFAGEHGACDDFDSAWGGHSGIVTGFVVDFLEFFLSVVAGCFCWGFGGKWVLVVVVL